MFPTTNGTAADEQSKNVVMDAFKQFDILQYLQHVLWLTYGGHGDLQRKGTLISTAAREGLGECRDPTGLSKSRNTIWQEGNKVKLT